MATIKISELRPPSSEVFQDYESFLNELTAREMGSVKGGVCPSRVPDQNVGPNLLVQNLLGGYNNLFNSAYVFDANNVLQALVNVGGSFNVVVVIQILNVS